MTNPVRSPFDSNLPQNAINNQYVRLNNSTMISVILNDRDVSNERVDLTFNQTTTSNVHYENFKSVANVIANTAIPPVLRLAGLENEHVTAIHITLGVINQTLWVPFWDSIFGNQNTGARNSSNNS